MRMCVSMSVCVSCALSLALFLVGFYSPLSILKNPTAFYFIVLLSLRCLFFSPKERQKGGGSGWERLGEVKGGEL